MRIYHASTFYIYLFKDYKIFGVIFWDLKLLSYSRMEWTK